MDTTQNTQHTPGSDSGPAHPSTTLPVTGERSPAKFRRSRENRILGGVCGGLARTLNLDIALVRVLAVVLTLVTSGLGAVAYVAAWLVVPEDGTETTQLGAMLRR